MEMELDLKNTIIFDDFIKNWNRASEKFNVINTKKFVDKDFSEKEMEKKKNYLNTEEINYNIRKKLYY